MLRIKVFDSRTLVRISNLLFSRTLRRFFIILKWEQHFMSEVLICAAVRTPIGRYAGSLSSIRADDLAAHPIKTLIVRHPNINWSDIDDVIFGCANQAGEDNRNVARMASLLAGLPETVGGTTINRLCASGMDAVLIAARAIISGEMDLLIAGGVENMSRAPFVIEKADSPFSRQSNFFDTTIGWRFKNPKMDEMYDVDSMPETAENVAKDFNISRADQDSFALWSQQKASASRKRLALEIEPIKLKSKKGDVTEFSFDENPREVTLEGLSKLKAVVYPEGSVTAGNASGVNDGACALLLSSPEAAYKSNLKPLAKIVMGASCGVAPRVMGIGPVPAIRILLEKTDLNLDDIDVIELNEAFASQSLAVMRELGIDDRDSRINPNGGAIALGHPLGMSGARIIASAAYELHLTGKKRAICSMCVGVGQGVAVLIERVD
jgi:acetyl-CoA acyltransferase